MIDLDLFSNRKICPHIRRSGTSASRVAPSRNLSKSPPVNVGDVSFGKKIQSHLQGRVQGSLTRNPDPYPFAGDTQPPNFVRWVAEARGSLYSFNLPADYPVSASLVIFHGEQLADFFATTDKTNIDWDTVFGRLIPCINQDEVPSTHSLSPLTPLSLSLSRSLSLYFSVSLTHTLSLSLSLTHTHQGCRT